MPKGKVYRLILVLTMVFVVQPGNIEITLCQRTIGLADITDVAIHSWFHFLHRLPLTTLLSIYN